MAWTSPATYTTGQVLTASNMNTYLRDNMSAVGASFSAWTSYSPTWGGTLTPGNGTSTGYYLDLGKLIHWRARFVWGSTSSGSTGVWTVTLPATARSITPAGFAQLWLYDVSTTTYTMGFLIYGTTTASLYRTAAGGSYVDSSQITSGAPFTWTVPDEIQIAGTYEAA